MSPIENLWAIVEDQLRDKVCTTKTRLIVSIIQIWYHDEEIKQIC